MDLGSPISSVIPSAHGPVLAILAGTEAWLSTTQVEKLLDGAVSRRRTADVLVELTTHGIADQEIRGSGNVFRLNRDHLAASSIVALANMRQRLIELIQEFVDEWSPSALAVWLFGSVARGDGGAGSDVDLFIIRPPDVAADDEAWLGQLDRLADRVVASCGNACQILDPSLDRFQEMVQQNERLVEELTRSGLRISGAAVRTLIRGAKARDAP